MRDLDEFESRSVQAPLKVLVPVKVTIGFLNNDMSFEQEALNHLLDVKGRIVSFLSAEDDVFQVEEHRHRRIRIVGVHLSSKAMPEAEINYGFSGSRSVRFGGAPHAVFLGQRF